MISVLTRWCAAPINPTNTKEEIRAELESTRALAILIMAGAAANDAALDAAQALGIGVIVITPTGAVSGLFHLALLHKVPEAAAVASNFVGYTIAQTAPGFVSYDHPETVLLLHTSGTSGNKKLVPYSLDMIVVGVACIVSSWNLTPADVCLNMMPLFHIGGIMRNILSPVLSGGCVIACSGFDPLLFWDVLTSPSSAAPRKTHEPGQAREQEEEEDSGRLLRATWYFMTCPHTLFRLTLAHTNTFDSLANFYCYTTAGTTLLPRCTTPSSWRRSDALCLCPWPPSG